MSENSIYFNWECSNCNNCVCKATTAENPENYINSLGKKSYNCNDNHIAKWVPVKAHMRDIDTIRRSV